jgi:signal transduction histidine kinase
VVLAGAVWQLVGRALAPVDAVRREVDAISASELHRRVPEPPGTDEIARLTATMNRMLARLQLAQDDQRRFVSDASHELRSPIAAIRPMGPTPRLPPPDDEDNLPRLRERYAYVLRSMAETGAITPEQAAKYAAKLPKFPDVKANERFGGPKGFLLKMVERELATADIEASQVRGGGLKIVTTFDKNAQDAAVESAQKYTKRAAEASDQKASKLHAAIASVDVGSGEVIAATITRFEMSVDQVEEILDLGREPVSLETPVGGEEGDANANQDENSVIFGTALRELADHMDLCGPGLLVGNLTGL